MMDNEVILLQTKKSELWKVNTYHQRLLVTFNTNTRKQRETLSLKIQTGFILTID